MVSAGGAHAFSPCGSGLKPKKCHGRSGNSGGGKAGETPCTLLNQGWKVRHWEKLQAAHGAQRHFIGKKGFLWERLSASIVAAGKPLPQKMTRLT
jgi:hypothetical protein